VVHEPQKIILKKAQCVNQKHSTKETFKLSILVAKRHSTEIAKAHFKEVMIKHSEEVAFKCKDVQVYLVAKKHRREVSKDYCL
jgi:hypothetical protein